MTSPITSTVAPSRLQERGVPVAADLRGLRGGLVTDDDLGVVGLGRLGQQRALQALREAALLLVQAVLSRGSPARPASSRAVCRSGPSSAGRPVPLNSVSSPRVLPGPRSGSTSAL